MRMYGYPQIFKEIFKNFPTLAIKCLSWKDLITHTHLVSKNYLKSYTPQELLSQLSQDIPQDFAVSTTSVSNQEISQANIKGDELLELYFCQFKNPHGILLDLRSHNFSQAEDQKTWTTNHIWYQFQESFRLNIINLYLGFYNDNLELFYEALENLGMTHGLNDQYKAELKDLFFSHFGEDTSKVFFSLEKFNQSFLEIFKFFMRHQIKLHIDFLFLGVYLTTLYMHMDQHKESSFNVKAVFHKQFRVS